MVDYSKWDHLDVSDDEDDQPRRPNVTRYGELETLRRGPIVLCCGLCREETPEAQPHRLVRL